MAPLPLGRIEAAPFTLPLGKRLSDRWSTVGAMLLSASLLAACGAKTDSAAPAAGGPPKMPAPEVSVVTVEKTTVGLTTELPGRLEASRVAQVRARAAGILQKRLFREGSEVKSGQPLFEIDSAPYGAALDSALAQQARAEASVAQTAAQVDRFRPLVEANAISKQDFANAVAAQKTAEADRAMTRAAIKSARINLGYTKVTAPIAGRIGRSLVTEGALVGQGEATQLAVIQQTDPLYVNFTQSTNEVLQLRRSLASGKLQRVNSDDKAVPIRILLDDGSEYQHTGRLLFTDLTVDATSGQVTLRAELPNPQRLLLPGMYVRVRLEQAQMAGGILLPQQAVTRGGTGDSVIVVGADNKPAPRQIKISSAQGNSWLITDGLQPGEKVVVAGFQKMMVPGAPVKPVPWQPANGGVAASTSGDQAKMSGAAGAGVNAAGAGANAASRPAAAASGN